MTIDLNFFNKFFIDYQQRFVHFACTYVHDEAVAEDFVIYGAQNEAYKTIY